MARKLEVTMPAMHSGQLEVANHPARFKVLAAGRRWRKSSLGVNLCLATGLKGGIAWWIAPSYPMAAIGWRMLTRLSIQVPHTEKREVDKMVILPTMGHVQIKSADNPDSLRGEGLNLAVLDECAFMKEAAWTEALRPALSDKLGGALFLSTPKGRNWFWQTWLKGRDDLEGEWMSWQLPTATNPHIKPKEIEAAKRNLPERVFLQEYMAEFIEDAGAVFRGVMDAATSDPNKVPPPLAPIAIGVDWAKHLDFTVFSVVDTLSRRQIYQDRFNQIDYTVQTERLKALCDKYKPFNVIVERNAMGEPLIEQLQRDGLPVVPFTTTNATKAVIIDDLALAFERGTIEILNDPVLIGELQAYEMERLPSGVFRYQAPEGMHDDTVMALALAWSAVAGDGAQDIATAPATGGGDW